MNIFKKFYCRAYQGAFRMMLPILPYRQPKPLQNCQDIVYTLQDHKIKSVLLVTDKGIRGLGLTHQLEDEIKENKIALSVYDKTLANPTTANVEEAVAMYKENGCQSIIAFGGGSAMDCAKATGARIACPKKSLAKMKGVLKVGKKLPLRVLEAKPHWQRLSQTVRQDTSMQSTTSLLSHRMPHLFQNSRSDFLNISHPQLAWML